jgi:hypothetical protein
MIVVAGPPGSGKSILFPVHSFEVDYFNADDRSAQFNGGSYRGISLETRAIVKREFEQFVKTISGGASASRSKLLFVVTLHFTKWNGRAGFRFSFSGAINLHRIVVIRPSIPDRA